MFMNFCKDLVYLRNVEKLSIMETRVCWDGQGVGRNSASGGRDWKSSLGYQSEGMHSRRMNKSEQD